MQSEITAKSDTSVRIKGSLQADTVMEERDAVLRHLGKDVRLDGFRPGKVPEKILLEHVDQSTLWKEMATRALSKALPNIVKEHSIMPIGHPSINVTKLAPDNPLEFTIEFSLLPEITLPDYVSIAKKQNAKKESSEVTEKDIEEAILNIRTRFAEAEKPKTKEDEDKKDVELPEFTEDFVKKLGPYTDIADFKTKLTEQIKSHKSHMAIEKNRLAIIEGIIGEAKPKVPKILVDAELDKMLAQMRADIQRAGMEIDKYMEQIGKTEENFKNDWKGDAEKRAQIQLVLNEIAKVENIKADEKEVEGQTKQLLAQHPPTKGDLKHAEIATKIYVATQLTNEKVFTFLEKQES